MVKSVLEPVIFLPGVIMPAAVQYRRLADLLEKDRPVLMKDLELYAGESPDTSYNLDTEVAGLARAADTAGWPRFHLVGYSGGGGVALAFAARHPQRVISLALGEPAVVPAREWLQAEAAYMRRLNQAMTLPAEEQMREFTRLQLRPGVQAPPPPPGDPPPWMSKRPQGMIAMSRAFSEARLSLDELRRYTGPVYLAIGSLSDPIEERKAQVLAGLFPDLTCEVYAGRHHFDLPQRSEPERFARALLSLWQRAEAQG